MTNEFFNSGFISFLIWVLLFAVSTAALPIAIRCVWVLRKSIFATAEFEEKLIPFLFLCTALTLSLLPLRVQAASPQRVLSAQPPTSCPEPAGQGRDGLIADADRDHSAPAAIINASRIRRATRARTQAPGCRPRSGVVRSRQAPV